MFEGFRHERVPTGEVTINAAIGGGGPPLLLLHGYPQCHAMWHKVAPRLAQDYTVVAADLRGYGDSDTPPGTPPGGPAHAAYAKRAMAADQVGLMRHLGFERFRLVGHDRGARVAHRLALDHAGRVERLAVLDIVPTLAVLEMVDQQVATGYYHWFFLIQADGFPERLIGNDPAFYLRRKIGHWSADAGGFTEAALAEYLRCFTPETIHASCEDYRAAASIDLEHDRADRAAGRRVTCPTLALWGARGLVGRAYDDVLQIWRRFAEDVRGQPVDCGHFLAEEAPEATLALLLPFLAEGAG